jgi:hypothetical protein
MTMSEYRLDEAFRVGEAEGIAAARVVVRGSSERECVLPAEANAAHVLGITTQSQPSGGRYVAVRRAGFVKAIAAGVINIDEPVCVADNLGRVRQLPHPRFTFGTLEDNNALLCDWLGRDNLPAPLTVKLVYPGGTTAFAWSFTGGALEIQLSGSGGNVTETANTLLAAVEADAELSRLVSFQHATGSNGTGVLAAATAELSNPTELLNPIGTAQQGAAQAGDLITVLLRA